MIRNWRDSLRLEQFALVCSTENVPRSHQCSAICKVVRLVDVSVSQQQDKITPRTHRTQMNSSLLQILRNPYLLQNLDIRSMNEQVKKKKKSFRSPPKGLVQIVHMVPEKTWSLLSSNTRRALFFQPSSIFQGCHDYGGAMAPHTAAGSAFHWSVMECWITVVFLRAINILLCTDFYLQHLDSSSLIKSCDLHKQNCCSLNFANYQN